jgi:hypothetical protein
MFTRYDNNKADVSVQQLVTHVTLCMMDYMTTRYSSFVLNSHWNSVCSVDAVFYWHSVLFAKNMGDKLFKKRISIKLLMKLEKNTTDIYEML